MMSAEEKYDDDQLRILLEEAGLESVPFDPVSLEALRELITAARTCRQEEEEEEEEELELDEAVDSWLTPAAAVDAAAATTSTSTSTTTNTPDYNKFKTKWHLPPKEGQAWQHLALVEDKPFAPLAGATEVENKIAELLHTQTKMLISMSRRIDELTAKVDQLTHGTTSTSNNNQLSSSFTVSTRTTTGPRYTTPTAYLAEAKATTDRIQRPTPAAPAAAAAAAAPIPAPVNDGLLPWHVKVYRIALLFVQLRRRHVQELDGGLIFKILFMMAILTARMSGHSSSKKHGDADWHAKFAALVVVVLMGFLVQTGYIKYCYIFFVKEQYPARIWNGQVTVEDILNNNDNNRINNNNNNPNIHHHGLPRGPLPPNQRDNNNNNNPAQPPQPQGWRNTFLGGLIPEANPEQQQQQGAGAAALGVLQDVALLLGSFLMSIFPMWHPEGPPRRPPPLNEQAPPQPPQQQQPVQQQGMAAPGVVQPPRNAMQPVEDDDDDDDNNNQ